MLKSIVNGAEHDIISIPMKGKNLWNPDSRTNNQVGQLNWGVVLPAGVYTIVNNSNTSVYQRDGIDSTQATTFAAAGTTKTVRFYNALVAWTSSKQTQIMLNTGSTALPYEPYGYQNGWEIRDNQNRLIWGREDELQTTTGTLLFKGYDLPIKVKSLLGNSVQNGTPSPDNVVVPEFCGVRTKNICPSAMAETKTNNGITAVSNGSGTYHVSGTATADADIRFNVQSFWIPQSIGNYHDGTFSMFNSAIYDNTAVKLAFYYQGTKLDDWGLTTLNRTSTTYAIMSEKDCDAIGFTVKSGVTVDFTISPEFTNDRVLPTEFEPYGYKITFDNNGENLFDKNATDTNNGFVDSGYLYNTGGVSSSSQYFVSEYIPTQPNTEYTLVYSDSAVTAPSVCFYDSSKTFIDGERYNGRTVVTFTTPNETAFIRFSGVDSKKSITMLNIGSTALPYSPYLNKTTPIYLSEVPTIRRIKKLVLTGEETWVYESAYTRFYTEFRNSLIIGLRATPAFCTHFQVISDSRPLADVPNDSMYSNSNVDRKWFFKKTDYTTVDEWKSYLSDQYNSGTPVTVWYILTNPETGIINEQLCKIGDYADELTEISVHNLSAPLYGIGDYKDILNLSTGVVTRNIKKLVLDGTESWYKNGNTYLIRLGTIKSLSPGIGLVSTHYPPEGTIANVRQYTSTYWSSTPTPVIGIRDESHTSVTDFKAFLDAQYASGSPVTVWYILAEPETETVTVPTGMTGEIEGYLTQISIPTPTRQSIPKWNGKEETGGTYAVTVYTLPEIPTTTGQNTLTVETEKIHGLTNPLCGIGDYKDVLNLSTGVITRKVKKLVLTGEETIAGYNMTATGIGFRIDLSTMKLNMRNNGYCTHFQPQMTPSGSAIDGVTFGANSNAIYFTFSAESVATYNLTDLASIKTFLATQYARSTPVTVWYVLNTPETETITVPYGLDCTVEGYLTQSGTPTPSNPITPESNGILESDGTYAVEVSLVPSNLTVKGHIKPIQ